ncbi:MAG: nucleoside phosphorylase [Promethearchaeota archaeon]
MLNNIKSQILNMGLKFISTDDKIVRMLLETASSNVSEIVILPAVKPVMKKLVKKLHNKIVHGRVYNGSLNGVRVSIILSHVGCPNIAMTMECLKRCKTKVVLRVDLCGGIQGNEENITVGDVLIPKLAYCDDGTSPQYIRSNASLQTLLESINNPLKMIQNMDTGNQIVYSSKPNEMLTEVLMEIGRTINPRIKEVDFWTTDALFCETSEFIRSLQSINVQGIDMESSALFLLGTLFNIKTASILAITDLPGHPKYDLLTSNEIHPNMGQGIDDIIKIVIGALPKIKSLFT